MTKSIPLLTMLLSTCAFGQRNESAPQVPALTARPAPEWTTLFERQTGWLAADGIYSISLSDSLTLFYFSDTVLGDGRGERIRGVQFINNTVALLEGTRPDSNNIAFFWRSSPGAGPARDTLTVFVPRTSSATGADWYWLGDGFVNHALNDTTYLFAYRMTRTEGSGIFNFAPVGVSLLAIPPGSQPPFSDHVQRETPFFVPATEAQREVVFGSGILENTAAAGAPEPDGYLYLYGIDEEHKGLVAARVEPAAFTDFGAWRFWDGHAWSTEIADAATITTRVSNELSVTPLADGRYLLVFQLDTNGPEVAVRVGESPVGPFGEIQTVYRCPEADADFGDLDLFCYNAKAHPHLSRDGKLLISYNVNAFGGDLDALALAHHYYHPRFIWLDLD